MTIQCPICGKTEPLVCNDCLGRNESFYSCRENVGGCGSTFRVTPDGEYVDIFRM